MEVDQTKVDLWKATVELYKVERVVWSGIRPLWSLRVAVGGVSIRVYIQPRF